MPYPYAASLLEALMAAQTSLAAVLTALLWFRPLRPWPASALLLASIWAVAILPVEPNFLAGIGAHLAKDHVAWVMDCAGAVSVLSMIVARPRWIAVPCALGAWALSRITDWAQDATLEVGALHLVWFGLLLGLHARSAHPCAPAPLPHSTASHRLSDVVLFAAAAGLALAVEHFVLFDMPGSGDEWANMYQADLLAHLKAYGTPPPCPDIFQSFWVFFYEGRSFSQYTPGWPLVLAPFQRLGLYWLANPVVLGVLAVGVARVARRAAAAGLGGVSVVGERHVAAAGVLAAATATLGASMLLNGGSEYAHPMVAAGFVWSVESLAAMSSPDTGARRKWVNGLVLGSASALMACARPGEGVLLEIGVFLFFVYALARRRLGLRPVLATAVSFALLAGFTLVVLRLQLGAWFRTAYSITGLFHPWAVMVLKAARPQEMRHVVPLATGAYMWWPAAPALGVAGLLLMRGRARATASMLAIGPLCLLGFFYFNGFLHAPATGYGPRFHLPFVIPMAVGTGVLLAPLWVAACRRWTDRSMLATGGPAVIAILAGVLGIVRIAPLVYPPAWAEMHRKTAPIRAIRAARLHHAVVTVTRHEVYSDPLDLVQNYASDTDPDVLIVHEWDGPQIACGKERWADRQWWHVSGMDEATLRPE